MAPMLQARTNLALCAERGRLFAAGGEDAHNHILSSVEMYDPESGTWTQVADLKQARRSFALTILRPGVLLAVRCWPVLFVCGWGTRGGMGRRAPDLTPSQRILQMGGSKNGQIFDTAELYDIDKDQWQPTKSLFTDRRGCAAVHMGQGLAYAAAV